MNLNAILRRSLKTMLKNRAVHGNIFVLGIFVIRIICKFAIIIKLVVNIRTVLTIKITKTNRIMNIHSKTTLA